MKLIILALLMFTTTNLLAADFCVSIPDEQTARTRVGVTKNGKACNEGEDLSVCAKRLVIRFIKSEVKNYEERIAREAAESEITEVTVS